jgi:hypothetical protein
MELSGQLHAPAASPLGKSHGSPLYRRHGGAQNRSWCNDGVKNFLSCRESNLGRPARNLVTILTQVPRFFIVLTTEIMRRQMIWEDKN